MDTNLFFFLYPCEVERTFIYKCWPCQSSYLLDYTEELSFAQLLFFFFSRHGHWFGACECIHAFLLLCGWALVCEKMLQYCTSFRMETLRLIITFLVSLSWMSQGYHSIEENDSLHEWPQRFLRIRSLGFSALTNLGLEYYCHVNLPVTLIHICCIKHNLSL